MEETEKITMAQKARGAKIDEGNLIARAKSMIPILVPLFMSAIRRAVELADAMEARCYNGGKGRTKMKPLIMKSRDYKGILIIVLFGDIYFNFIKYNFSLNLYSENFINIEMKSQLGKKIRDFINQNHNKKVKKLMEEYCLICVENYDKINSDNSNDVIRRAITNKVVNARIQKSSQVTKSMGRQLKNNERIFNDDFSNSESSSSDSDDSNNSVKNVHTTNLLGLFSLIGNFEKNILLSVSCLDLLVKMLSHEFNPKPDIYIEAFKERRIQEYQSLKLDYIIRSNEGGERSTSNALRILCILFREDPRMEPYLRVVLKNDVAYKRYKIFERNFYD